LGGKKTQSYDACPYCLTEIIVETSSPIVEEEEEPITKGAKIEEANVHLTKEKPVHPAPVQGCRNHLGYLSERSSKEKIPEECMMCSNIVQCMLKNVTG
jgi:hypothetical protein